MKIRVEQNAKGQIRVFDEDNTEYKIEGYVINKKTGYLITLKLKLLGEVNKCEKILQV